MSNEVYPLLLEYFIEFLINNDVKASLINTSSYTYTPSTDKYYSVIPSNAIIASGVSLINKRGSLGSLMADPTTWDNVSGNSVGAVVLYQDTGNPATSRLVSFLDTITGLPLTPNGSSIQINWDTTNGYIFKL